MEDDPKYWIWNILATKLIEKSMFKNKILFKKKIIVLKTNLYQFWSNWAKEIPDTLLLLKSSWIN